MVGPQTVLLHIGKEGSGRALTVIVVVAVLLQIAQDRLGVGAIQSVSIATPRPAWLHPISGRTHYRTSAHGDATYHLSLGRYACYARE